MARGSKAPSEELIALGEKLTEAMGIAAQADIDFFNLARAEYDDGDGVTITALSELVPLTYATCRTRVQASDSEKDSDNGETVVVDDSSEDSEEDSEEFQPA